VHVRAKDPQCSFVSELHYG